MRKPAFFKMSRLFVVVVLAAVSLTPAVVHNYALAFSPANGLTEPTELEAFMDGIIEAQLEAYQIAGAAVAVVKKDALFFAKGYGSADLKNSKPVQAEKTLFRIASISKLFVWTAVMQLVEQGKLDLNADINTYLTHFKIPDTYTEPITLTHLMTHTSGFEDHIIRLFTQNADRLLPLEDILAHDLPARVRRPGDIAAYSNHGAALAAYIVEQVSGKSWNDYVEENILRPLKMTRTTFRQPVPARLSADLSKGYNYRNGEFYSEPFVYVPLAPVASASSTATDMANFMIAHLNLGRLGDARILDSPTARQMHSALFRHAAEVNPMAHGFIDMSRNCQWVIGHSGNLIFFHSLLILLPEHEAGLFISYNTQGGQRAAKETYELFMNRYYPPGPLPAATGAKISAKELQRFAGSYFSSRRVHRRFTKLGAVLNPVRVSLAEDGTLKTTGSETNRWIPTRPLTFREKNGWGTLAFRQDANGRITHMFMGDRPYIAFERIGYADSIILHIVLATIAIFLFFTAVVSWPFAALLRRRYKLKPDRRTRIPRPAYIVSWSTSALFIVVAALLAFGLSDPNSIVFGIPMWIKLALVLSTISILMTAGTVLYAIVIWKSGRGSMLSRVYYTTVVLGFITASWQLNHWNLIGFQY